MSGLDTLNQRLQYQGGNQEGRFINDKARSLNKALLYSYQAETAVLADGREFRCLINPDKLKNDYEDKIISIPFRDICLNKTKSTNTTSDGLEEIGMKAGDVFEWKETNTYWLVYLQRLEENAYFRAEIRKCSYELTIDDDHTYKIYLCGPAESSIVWHTKKNMKGSGITWNDLNYDLTMYITKDETTLDFLHRFTLLKINGKQYEVQAVDNISVEGVIEVALKEYYTNEIQDLVEESKSESEEEEETKEIYISGNKNVYPYEEYEYTIVGASDGEWSVSNKQAIIQSQDAEKVTLTIVSGRSGNFDLIYKYNEEEVVLNITIDSL